MFTFKQITETNGIDINNLKNSRQNSYAWSMAELGNYIYVGTSRNMISSLTTAFTESSDACSSLVTGSDVNVQKSGDLQRMDLNRMGKSHLKPVLRKIKFCWI
ncbi:MAG: hypothetical protein ACLS28_13030 [Clostridium neonatale]